MKRIGKQKDIQDRIERYCSEVRQCLVEFQKTFRECCENPSREALRDGYQRVHAAEGKADDIRRELENLMYSRAIFPESRGDILGLVETMDRVPNNAESTIRMVLNQHIEIPIGMNERLLDLVSACVKCVDAMLEGVSQLFKGIVDATITIGKIDELESEADRIEENLIDWVFSSDVSDLQKILLRDLVDKLGGIPDRSENVGDRMRIMVAKRSV